jgi:SAM-dependent methyltransferase
VSKAPVREPWTLDLPDRFQPDPELSYSQLVRRVRDVVLCTVPRATRVLVITDGDDDFLQRLDGRPAQQFPSPQEGNGISPADGDALVAALEQERDQGAHFLVVPVNTYSWFSRYPEFAGHLERNYHKVKLEPQTCEIFALTDETFADERDPDTDPELSELNPNRAIASGDLGFRADPDGYFRWGWLGLRCVELALQAARKETVDSILDLPCGHGRVLRALQAKFPEAKLTACDIDRDGVDFCAEVFGATPVYSEENPADVSLPDSYDLIWCGSLLTHLPADRCSGFIELFANHLNPGGIAVFTTHGHLYAELLRQDAINSSVVDPQQIVQEYKRHGFGYQDYMFGLPNVGFTVSSPSWVCRELERHPGLRLVLFSERAWGGLQDVVTCVRVPEDNVQKKVEDHKRWLDEAEPGARAKLAAEYRNMHEYRDLVNRIRDVAQRTLPKEATVVVVSRGDELLVQLDGSQGWHFPRDEQGRYPGHHPEDSATAIEQLEELRAEGADYFLLPASSFWWLEHYEQFAAHLEGRYPVVVRLDDTCLIYGLTEDASGGAVHATSVPPQVTWPAASDN